MSQTVSTVMAFILGTILGSFLNVVIYRLPRNLSIVRPGSRCPHCQTPIRPQDNIPLVSFLVLRGRCRVCRAPIGWRYPLVEAVSGGLLARGWPRVAPGGAWVPGGPGPPFAFRVGAGFFLGLDRSARPSP